MMNEANTLLGCTTIFNDSNGEDNPTQQDGYDGNDDESLGIP
jgi:hypothetical protein